jgi:hypothetical protein
VTVAEEVREKVRDSPISKLVDTFSVHVDSNGNTVAEIYIGIASCTASFYRSHNNEIKLLFSVPCLYQYSGIMTVEEWLTHAYIELCSRSGRMRITSELPKRSRFQVIKLRRTNKRRV